MGLVVGGAITLAAFTFWVGASWQFRYALLAALATSLVFTQFLAHGMTSPLRQMTAAARAMARGDYSRPGARHLARRNRATGNGLQSDGGRPRRRRRVPARAHRQRVARIAHARSRRCTRCSRTSSTASREPDPETMRMALSQTERLGELVANLLDLSRLEGGAIPLQPSSFRVDEFLREAVGHVALSPHGVDVVVHGRRRPTWSPSPTPRGCGRWWSTWWTTRFGTARRAAGCPCSARAAEPSGLRLEVCDEGPGIPAAERERVFQRFTRGATSAGGTGLGLAIARWAVELHGGAIEVMRRPGGLPHRGHDPATRRPRSST